MLTVSQTNLAQAFGLSRNTVTARTRGLNFSTSVNGVHRYRLADVLHITKLRERGNVPALFKLAADDGEKLFVGDDGVTRARQLEAWLGSKEHARLCEVRGAFAEALVASVRTSVLFEHYEALRLKLVLADPVLRWVVLADAKGLPSFGRWATAFAIINARYENLYNKEAA